MYKKTAICFPDQNLVDCKNHHNLEKNVFKTEAWKKIIFQPFSWQKYAYNVFRTVCKHMSRDVIKSRKSSHNAKAYTFLYKTEPWLPVTTTETSDFQKRNRVASDKKRKREELYLNLGNITTISEKLKTLKVDQCSKFPTVKKKPCDRKSTEERMSSGVHMTFD